MINSKILKGHNFRYFCGCRIVLVHFLEKNDIKFFDLNFPSKSGTVKSGYMCVLFKTLYIQYVWKQFDV